MKPRGSLWLSALLLGSAIAQGQAPAASNSASARNSTVSGQPSGAATLRTTIQLPPLYSCDFSTWTYTAPAGPKYLGFYVSGTTSWIETYSLPTVYDDRTNGTFTWKCDLPAGLSVAAMFYVVQNGASGTNGAQASTPDALINAGSGGLSCLGTNDAGSQAKILSLASSLDPSFFATSSGPQASSGSDAGSGHSDTNIGAIVGGVVGGALGIALLGALLIYLKRKHDNAAWNGGDGLSVYSGRSEKVGSTYPSHFGGAPMSLGPAGHAPPSESLAAPPPGTYYAADANGNVHLMMGYPSSADPETPIAPPSERTLASPISKPTAPPGTLPEPMDDSEEVLSQVSPASRGADQLSVAPSTLMRAASPAVAPQFQPAAERTGVLGLGAQGLDDPSSFSPQRQTHRVL
ncbi:hypothetical protein BMF94_6220 [Rhodotorula taiwanensis]|uniref:Uncharacterized protein n=1 Tax=Rhodotorula taiwanensis TaxID=741276 RepID=A0A2S5B201_9BASI|nr:hypothetical protein BMF94_6220 [Rhodotorula taiwanensis]